MKYIKYLALIASLFSVTKLTFGNTFYVSDNLSALLRKGESLQHAIIRELPSGTPLEIIATNPETGYAHVRLSNGTEGFLLSRFLDNEKPARQQLSQAHAQLQNLRQENKKVAQTNQTLQSSLNEIEQQHTQDLQELEKLREIAANPLRLEEENLELKTLKEELQTQVNALSQSNIKLKSTYERQWFLTGALVVLISFLLGMFINNYARRRRQSSWSNAF